MKTNLLSSETILSRGLPKSNWLAVACLTLGGLFIAGEALAQPPFSPLPSDQDEDDQQPDTPVIIRPPGNRTPTIPFRTPQDQGIVPDQIIKLNDRFAGWKGAGLVQNKAGLSDELRANWVMVDADGRFDGKVIPGVGTSTEMMTVFLLHMGRLVKETRVQEDGGFVFTNVREGAYALVGWGSTGFFAFGINILEFNPEAPATTPRSVWPIAFQNETTINTDWIQAFAPSVSYRVYGRFPTGQGPDDPAALYGYEGLSEFLPKAVPATSVSAHPAKLTADGRLIGRVHQMTSRSGRPVDLRTTRVMLFRGNEVIAATDSNNFGVFEFEGVTPGQYALAASGVDGLGLIGINVVESAATTEVSVMNEEGEFLKKPTVKAVDEPNEYLDFCIAPSETVGWLNHYADELAYRRNLLAPRRPDSDQNQQGTCPNCNGMGCPSCGGTGLCTSRQQTFEDWAQRCCQQRERTRLGSGYIISAAAKDVRQAVDRSGDTFEKAFYGEGGYNGGGPAGGGYGGFYGNGGANLNGGGYNGTGYNGFDPNAGGYNGNGYNNGGYNGGGANINGAYNYAPPAPLP